jgi:predicted TPR repeat methyltransferase
MLLLAPHKNNASDAYVIVLFDDYAAVKPEINAALGSLKFK